MTFSRFYTGKKVLLTGHTGFKGSWLTEWLLMMGAKVTGLSLPPATEPALFDQLGLAARCDHRIADIRDGELVHRIVHEIRPDLVFHLAAQPLVRHSYAKPVETYETNVLGTAHVLDALRDADWPCATVMITTDKVYENKESSHAYREDDPLGGYDPYSSSKACAELVIQSYRQSFFNPVEIAKKAAMGANAKGVVGVASARAGNVIGGGDWAQDRIVPDCMRALAGGRPIVVRNPHATRPWQHVLESLSGYLLLGMGLHYAIAGDPKSGTRDPKPKIRIRGEKTTSLLTSDYGPLPSDLISLGTSFNFGPPPSSNRPVRELVEAILRHWPGQWQDGSGGDAPHEAGLLNLATDKAFHVLGWRPRWDFEHTIAATVAWYKTIHEQGSGGAPGLVQRQIELYSEPPDSL